jgi:hypothetical protein
VSIGQSLGITELAKQCATPQDSEESEPYVALGNAVAILTEELPFGAITNVFAPVVEENPDVILLCEEVIFHVLRHRQSSEAFRYGLELLNADVKGVSSALYFAAKYHEHPPETWAAVNERHLERLGETLLDREEARWSFGVLKLICEHRPDLRSGVAKLGQRQNGFSRISLDFLAGLSGTNEVIQRFEEMAAGRQRVPSPNECSWIDEFDLDWTGNEALFVNLLQLRQSVFALALIESIDAFDVFKLENLDIGNYLWWLEWLEENSQGNFSFSERLGRFLGTAINEEGKNAILNEFNSSASKYRSILITHVLPYMKDLTTDSIGEDAKNYLLENLELGARFGFERGGLLGTIATDEFVISRVMPMLTIGDPRITLAAQTVLQVAGKRNGVRYLT